MTKLLQQLEGWEQACLLAFIGLNMYDCLLTSVMVSRGYLSLELMPTVKYLFTAFGPPSYSYWLFWVVKMGWILLSIPVLVLMAKRLPQLRRMIFVFPVVVMAGVCFLMAFNVVTLV
jgi:hypothetical protein